MSNSVGFPDLGGLYFLRLAFQPQRVLTISVYGLRKTSDDAHSHSEVSLQFINFKGMRISGMLSNVSRLQAHGAVQELGPGEEGLRTYKISFDTAQIDFVAASHTAWFIVDQPLGAKDEALLARIPVTGAKKAGMEKVPGRGVRRDARKARRRA